MDLTRSFCQLLITLAVFDIIFLVSAIVSFSLPLLSDNWRMVTQHSTLSCINHSPHTSPSALLTCDLAVPHAICPNIYEWFSLVCGLYSYGALHFHCVRCIKVNVRLIFINNKQNKYSESESSSFKILFYNDRI